MTTPKKEEVKTTPDSTLEPEVSASSTKTNTVHGTFGNQSSDNSTGPIADSGAEEHMFKSGDHLQEVRPIDKRLDPSFVNANGEPLQVTAVGIEPSFPEGANTVYVAPTLQRDLIATGQFENLGDGGLCVRIIDDPDNKRRQRWVVDGKTILTTELNRKTNLYDVIWLDARLQAKATKLWTTVERPKIAQMVQLFHVALGHAPMDRMIEVIEKKFIDNLPHELTVKAIRKYFPTACVTCFKGRAVKEPASAGASAMVAKPKPRPTRTQRAKKRAQLKGSGEGETDEEEGSDGEPASPELLGELNDACSDGGDSDQEEDSSPKTVAATTRGKAKTMPWEQQALDAAIKVTRAADRAKQAAELAAENSALDAAIAINRAAENSKKALELAAENARNDALEEERAANYDNPFIAGKLRNCRIGDEIMELLGEPSNSAEKLQSSYIEPPDEVLSCDIGSVAGAGSEHDDRAFDGSTHTVTFRGEESPFIHIAYLQSMEGLENVLNDVLERFAVRGRRIVTLRIDNQFVTDNVKKTLDVYGIKIAACAPHEHNQNGQAENTVQLVAREARTLMHGAHAEYPRDRWPKAYTAAVLALNMSLPSRTNPNISCWEDWHRTKLDFHKMALLPFGCKVYGHEETSALARLDSRVFAGFFELPSEIHHQVVSIYDPQTKQCKLRRTYWVAEGGGLLNRIIDGVEVHQIDEIKEPEVKSNTALNSRKAFLKARIQALRVTATKDSTCHFCKKRWTTHTDQFAWTAWYQCEFDKCAIWACEQCQPKMDAHEEEHRLKGDPLAPPTAPPVQRQAAKKKGKKAIRTATIAHVSAESKSPDTDLFISVPDKDSGEPRFYRIEEDSWHADALINQPSVLICAATRNPLDAVPLAEDVPPCKDIPEFEEATLDKYLAQFQKDPTGYKTMLKHPHAKEFKAAASAELQNVKDNNTWTEVKRSDIPAGARIHDSMFVFRTKRDSDGRFLKFKARLTFRGDQQDDVGDTWAPTIHTETWKFLLALGTRLDLEMSQIDIASAFLKEYMPPDMDDVYMRLPVAHTGDSIYVRLLRSLYGLREAPRIFHMGLKKHLISLGFKASSFDPCLFSKTYPDGNFVWAAMHVDDIYVLAKTTSVRDQFRSGMEARYELSWQDEATSFLGFTITRDRTRKALTISQPGYARHVVEMAGLQNAPDAPSPGDAIKFTGTSRGKGDPARLRNLVGLMQYLTNSRCDIIAELNKVAKTMSDPSAEDITAAERIIRYIKGTIDYGITFSGDGPCQVVGYADASYQSEKGGYSRTGIIMSLGESNGAFVAKSYTQKLISTSSQHSEIQALSDATRYAVYLRNIAAELGIPQEPVPMYEDNEAAKSFAKGESDFDKTKHILQMHRFCTEMQDKGLIIVQPIDTKLQRADQATKILLPSEHKAHTAINLNLANSVSIKNY